MTTKPKSRTVEPVERTCERCGKAFIPRRWRDEQRYCSKACSSQGQMISINYHKALPPGQGPAPKPLPVLTEAERADLEARLAVIRNGPANRWARLVASMKEAE